MRDCEMNFSKLEWTKSFHSISSLSIVPERTFCLSLVFCADKKEFLSYPHSETILLSLSLILVLSVMNLFKIWHHQRNRTVFRRCLMYKKINWFYWANWKCIIQYPNNRNITNSLQQEMYYRNVLTAYL